MSIVFFLVGICLGLVWASVERNFFGGAWAMAVTVVCLAFAIIYECVSADLRKKGKA